MVDSLDVQKESPTAEEEEACHWTISLKPVRIRKNIMRDGKSYSSYKDMMEGKCLQNENNQVKNSF